MMTKAEQMRLKFVGEVKRRREDQFGLTNDEIAHLEEIMIYAMEGIVPDEVLKAVKDEPLFVLRGQDESAAKVVHDWVKRQVHLTESHPKIKRALDTWKRMVGWKFRKQAD